MTIAIPLKVLPAKSARAISCAAPITVYGTWWSPRTQHVLRYLRHLDLPHHYSNIDANPDVERQLAGQVPGPLRTPVVRIERDWIADASIPEVRDCLVANGWLPRERAGHPLPTAV